MSMFLQATPTFRPGARATWLASAALAAVIGGCSGSSHPEPVLDVAGDLWLLDTGVDGSKETLYTESMRPDVAEDAIAEVCQRDCRGDSELMDTPLVWPEDTAPDLDLFGASDETEELGPGDQEAPDIEATLAPGEACANSAQCLTGDCSDTALGRFCAPLCASGCPKGWICKGGSAGSTCEPKTPPNCWTCDARHCPIAWCRPLGNEGEFCLSACMSKSQCPAGYRCEVDPGGLSFCVPPLPSCACAPNLVGFSVPCDVINEHGSCPGAGICTQDGLLTCEGPTPQLEICDGIDNNCDGSVDETFPDKSKPCDGLDPDLCLTGIWTCGPGGLNLVCSGEKPQLEVCDDKDNTCDGVVDEGFSQKGEICGVSPFCGVGYWACHPTNGKLYCKGVTPEPEVCDGKDNDCNGLVDEGFPDSDGNGFAECP